MFADEQEHEANYLNGNALLSSHRQYMAMLEGPEYMRKTADLLRQLVEAIGEAASAIRQVVAEDATP